MSRGAPDLETRAAAAVEELCSALDLVRWGASRFAEAGLYFGHGTDNAVDEARTLVLHALHLEPDASAELLSAGLTRDERAEVVALLTRRVRERIPAAYLMHRAWFAGLPFYVDDRVLVPRSPLAEWIEQGFAPWVDPDRVGRVLDVGTGSGCIAIACALAFQGAHVDAVDLSPQALEVAQINVREHGLEDTVTLIHGDLFSGLPDDARYDLIISNPPYVDAGEMAARPAEYRHEPELGLAAGHDGLSVVRRILHEAPGRLVHGGVLVVEVGASRPALEHEFPELPFVWLELAHGGENVFLLSADDLPRD